MKKNKKISLAKQVVKRAKRKIKPKKKTKAQIPSGSTMLNCACSDNPFFAFGLGKIVTIPGSSSSGKTMQIVTMFAECDKLNKFDDYSFFYDDCEEALGFDMKYLFGKSLTKRLLPPGGYDGEEEPIHSETIQDFKSYVLKLCKAGKPFIYALDSLDSLTTDEELDKEYKKALLQAKSDDHVKEIKGSFKMEKAKILGETLRMIRRQLKKTKSTLFIVQQERSKIGAAKFEKQTITSGGKAPFFYSSHQVWFTKSKTIKSQGRKIGRFVQADVLKNKLTGKERTVSFPIYNDYGIDDIGSCIDFLVFEGYWKKKGKTISAEDDIGINAIRSKLIKYIEYKNLEKELKEIVGKVWNEIEEKIKLNRKPKY